MRQHRQPQFFGRGQTLHENAWLITFLGIVVDNCAVCAFELVFGQTGHGVDDSMASPRPQGFSETLGVCSSQQPRQFTTRDNMHNVTGYFKICIVVRGLRQKA
jgi:hypothetical protein